MAENTRRNITPHSTRDRDDGRLFYPSKHSYQHHYGRTKTATSVVAGDVSHTFHCGRVESAMSVASVTTTTADSQLGTECTDPDLTIPTNTISQHHDDTRSENEGSATSTLPKKHPTRRKPRKKTNSMGANVSGTRYEIVRETATNSGFTIMNDEADLDNCYYIWSDASVTQDRISDLKPFQRLNHFPGMGEICRKDALARNMKKMSKAHPEDYRFIPKTWIFPQEYSQFQNWLKDSKRKKPKSRAFIVKPSNGAMGNGIHLYRNGEKIPQLDNSIVQEYLDKPLLMDGFKFDLRVYVLVTSCDPLRAFIFQDGLVRMSTEKYCHPTESNVDQVFMHLTNYSVNKHNENFERIQDYDKGSKRSIKFFNSWLADNDIDVTTVWKRIQEVIVKTLIIAEPHVLHSYRMCRPGGKANVESVCFEILGFDIFIDHKMKPWLLEVNRAPSFNTDEKTDYTIKKALLEDTIRLLKIRPSDKWKSMANQKAQAQRRLLKPQKRSENGLGELEKRRRDIDKRRDELKTQLNNVRRQAAKEEHEEKNMGLFTRIFPPYDRTLLNKYIGLIADAFQLFLSGRAVVLQKDIATAFNQNIKENEILDMLEQCEREDNRESFGPKPLSSMPSVTSTDTGHDNESCTSDSTNDSGLTTLPLSSRHSYPNAFQQMSTGSRAINKRSHSLSHTRSRTPSTTTLHRTLIPSNNRIAPVGSINPVVDENYITAAIREREEDYTRKTLVTLNELKIKFPGKSELEADIILSNILENWRYHKAKVASYWLVKLDTNKRKKVIDIVRSNVRSVLQKCWKTDNVENIKLFRIVNRVFNRLLWSHGQGLWNCFSSAGSCCWETIFSKSTDAISDHEMECCRRVVTLSKECLLIVYQFAIETQTPSSTTHMTVNNPLLGNPGRAIRSTVIQMPQQDITVLPMNQQFLSRRISRLYSFKFTPS